VSPQERFRAWCAALEYAPTQDALTLWASRRSSFVPRGRLVLEVDAVARALFPGAAESILNTLETLKII
jgi:hypothetical protein